MIFFSEPMSWYCHQLHYLILDCNIYCKVQIVLTEVLISCIFPNSLMLHRPLQFVDLTKLRTEKSHPAFHPSNKTGDQGLANTSNPEARWVDCGHAGQILPPCPDSPRQTHVTCLLISGTTRWRITSSRTLGRRLTSWRRSPRASSGVWGPARFRV